MSEMSVAESLKYEIREDPEEYVIEIEFDREPPAEVKNALFWLGMRSDDNGVHWKNMGCITRRQLEFVTDEAIAGRWSTRWWKYNIQSCSHGSGYEFSFGSTPPKDVLRRLDDFLDAWEMRYDFGRNCGYCPEHRRADLQWLMQWLVQPYVPAGLTDKP